jgi:hypothetical protein
VKHLARTLTSVLTVVLLALAGLATLATPASATPYTWFSKFQITSGTTPTGYAEVWFTADWDSTTGSVCVVDNATNGKGVFIRINGFWLDGASRSTPRFNSGAGVQKPYGQEYCTTFTLTGSTRVLLNQFRIDKGNYWGSTVQQTDSDWHPTQATGTSPRAYTVWQNSIPLRFGNEPTCSAAPSASNCTRTRAYIPRNAQVWVSCQKWGAQTVGGNPYWVQVSWEHNGEDWLGWIPSYPLNYPQRWVDHIPYC